MNFFQAHGPKTMKLFITKSCGDAKLELFPGARPPDIPDMTFTSWYDLTLALVGITNFHILMPALTGFNIGLLPSWLFWWPPGLPPLASLGQPIDSWIEPWQIGTLFRVTY